MPADVLSTCGFVTLSAAQEVFFLKTKLLHDFAVEDNLLLLQGYIILCMVILDRPTQWDFGYWLHNAIRLATKLDLRTAYVIRFRAASLVTVIACTDMRVSIVVYEKTSHAKS